MKSFYKISFAIVLIICFFSNIPTKSQVARDFCVMVSAETYTSPKARIKLMWEKLNYVTAFSLTRREVNSKTFDFAKDLQASDTVFIDENVVAGKKYEYALYGRSSTTANYYNKNQTLTWSATGYIVAGIDNEVNSNNHTVMLLVDKTIVAPLEAEIKRLENDLILDGFGVIRKEVNRCEQFDKNEVKKVKQLILDETSKDKTIKSLFILGRVAIPYSGNIVPDGHNQQNSPGNSHVGAWPADMYYGDLDEELWTDDNVNVTEAGREVNKNIVGDGKFDQSEVPQVYDLDGKVVYANDIDLMVGRVDFFNMPKFSESEIQLLKRYLDKNHKYRMGQIPISYKALIDDNFGVISNFQENFAASGWRNFPQIVGKNNTSAQKWLQALSTDNYLCAYGTGGGSYESSSGVARVEDFASAQHQGIFTLLFGSYFGDWDSPNNLMRSAIASDPSILTCGWAARPHWYLHDFAAGETIGYSARTSMNNISTYITTLFFDYNGKQYNNGYVVAVAYRGVHVALMGDPTLRIPFVENGKTMQAASALSLNQLGYNEIRLTWEWPNDSKNHAYDVFRSYSANGPFVKVNKDVITKTSTIDNFNADTTVYYLVRERKAFNTASGTIWANGRGVLGSIKVKDLSSIEDEAISKLSVEVSPNPTSELINIKFNNNQSGLAKIELIDAQGRIVANIFENEIGIGEQFISQNINNVAGNSLLAGAYLLRISLPKQTLSQKIIINR